jgi:outer membrane lipopolysaccharide assembly protein LptE/RlpB
MILSTSNKWTLFLLGSAIVFGGCAYHFSGAGNMPSGMTRIFVAVIENKTSEAGIENFLTDDVINEFILRRKESYSSQDDAEGILSGSIEYLMETPIAHSSQSVSTQRRITLGVNMKLTDRNGKTVWAVNGINSNQVYKVTTDKVLTEQNKKAAIQVLSKRLAEKILNRLTDDF